MSVTFVIGRAGSGKSARFFRAIVDAMRADPLGPRIYWILPRQATFDAERALTCGSGLGGFCRTRIVSFEQLGRDVFEDCGGSSIPEVTAMGRQMVLGHVLRQLQPQLEFFGGSARRVGLAAQLDEVFTEFEEAGHGTERLTQTIVDFEAAAAGDVDASVLLGKLRDLKRIYDGYTAYLGQERLDQHRRSQQVLASVQRCSFFHDAMVYVDGFREFTQNERQMLVGMARAGATIEVGLLLDPASRTLRDPHHLPDELSLFHRTEQAYRRLYFAFNEGNIPIGPPVLLRESHRYGNASLARIERSAFDSAAAPAEAFEGVELVEAMDRRGEVDAVCRRIQNLLAGGMRLREIGVLARNLSNYHVPIAASFAEHGIPYFLDRRRGATHHPLLRALHAVMQIARFDWPNDAVLTLMKSGITAVEAQEAEAVENYLLAGSVSGSASWESARPWQDLGTLWDPNEPPARTVPVDAPRRKIVEALRPLRLRLAAEAELPLGVMAAEIFAAFERLGVAERLEQWIGAAREAGEIEQAEEHEQVWAELVRLFEQMVDLLGGERMPLGQFGDILEWGLEQFDLALTPATIDQVLVGQVDRTRTPPLRAVFVLGLSEGEFPAASPDAALLSDRERRQLQARRMEIDPDSRRRLLDERLLGYIAMTGASERLFLSRAVTGKGPRGADASVFWQQVRRLFPLLQVHQVTPAAQATAADIATPRQLVTSLMRWVREPAAAGGDGATWESLYQWLCGRPAAGDAIDTVRYRSWKALSYTNEARLSAEMRARFFAPLVSVSVSQVESFASCPFQHFLRYGLKLRPREEQEVAQSDLARLYRELLEHLMSGSIRGKRRWDDSERPIDEASIEACAGQIDAALSRMLERAGARGAYLLTRARKTLSDFLTAQHAFLKRSKFQPAFTGVSFGEGGRVAPLQVTTPAGARVAIKGWIDRIDMLEGSRACCVVDYRLWAHPLWMDGVYYGLSLQLLAYLLVLRAGGERLAGAGGLDPAGAFFVQVPRRLRVEDHPDDAPNPDDPAFYLDVKPRGIFESDHLLNLDGPFSGGRSATLAVQIKKDGSLANVGRSDAATPAELEALLLHVRNRLGDLTGRIAAGEIDIAPYRLAEKSPCAHCDYQSICRFHVSTNQYKTLHPIGRRGVLEKLLGVNGNGH